MAFLINQIVLAFWNFINSRIDAYRIFKNKTIAHGVNFGIYIILITVIIYLFHMPFKESLLFACGSFFNRQLSFDIPLNLRRGLPWDYQSTANPPKALMDRIERLIFGIDYNNGKAIVVLYSWCFVLTFIIKFST